MIYVRLSPQFDFIVSAIDYLISSAINDVNTPQFPGPSAQYCPPDRISSQVSQVLEIQASVAVDGGPSTSATVERPGLPHWRKMEREQRSRLPEWRKR